MNSINVIHPIEVRRCLMDCLDTRLGLVSPINARLCDADPRHESTKVRMIPQEPKVDKGKEGPSVNNGDMSDR